ncbi:hypothetical protein DPMN_029638 [Dreissena polymorpha]|uniref:Uncharacterized protein n=1 Tax=Dreissena polymorpha TaxID=45954 RepID=A0A9D4RHB5_DREPO|nr:hypothetical protein DPMN_029638 [Dreissena polymorpha]
MTPLDFSSSLGQPMTSYHPPTTSVVRDSYQIQNANFVIVRHSRRCSFLLSYSAVTRNIHMTLRQRSQRAGRLA